MKRQAGIRIGGAAGSTVKKTNAGSKPALSTKQERGSNPIVKDAQSVTNKKQTIWLI